MSLQSNFELCLEYAEALEAKQDQLVQAQNNIIFMQNENERIKNKLRLCAILSVLSAVALLLLTFMMVRADTADGRELLPFMVILIIVFIVSFFNCIKTKKESDDFTSKKPFLIQQYTEEADECKNEMTRLVQEIYQEGLFDIVPMDYFSVEAIEFCLSQVRKKMANTAAEAFRQLDAEIKRLEHMEHLEQMNNARMEQLNEIKRAIEINTLVTLMEQENKTSE